jgi:hypothetical protein
MGSTESAKEPLPALGSAVPNSEPTPCPEPHYRYFPGPIAYIRSLCYTVGVVR